MSKTESIGHSRASYRTEGQWGLVDGFMASMLFCFRLHARCSAPLLPLPSTLIAPCIRREEEGGTDDESNVEAARNYVQTCIDIGPPMIKFDTMSKRMKFLYVEEGHREVFEKKKLKRAFYSKEECRGGGEGGHDCEYDSEYESECDSDEDEDPDESSVDDLAERMEQNRLWDMEQAEYARNYLRMPSPFAVQGPAEAQPTKTARPKIGAASASADGGEPRPEEPQDEPKDDGKGKSKGKGKGKGKGKKGQDKKAKAEPSVDETEEEKAARLAKESEEEKAKEQRKECLRLEQEAKKWVSRYNATISAVDTTTSAAEEAMSKNDDWFWLKEGHGEGVG